jgi:hypothetical protein
VPASLSVTISICSHVPVSSVCCHAPSSAHPSSCLLVLIAPLPVCLHGIPPDHLLVCLPLCQLVASSRQTTFLPPACCCPPYLFSACHSACLPLILPLDVCLSSCFFLSAGPYSSHQFQYLVWLLLSCLLMPAYPRLPAALLLFCLSVMAPVCLFVILSAASDLSALILDYSSACLRLIDQTYLLLLLGGQLESGPAKYYDACLTKKPNYC